MDLPASRATISAMSTADGPNHLATSMVHPHRSATCILYILHMSDALPREKFWGLISPVREGAKFSLNNGKVKIDYNSAYFQIETLNFTFPGKLLLLLVPNINVQVYFLANRLRLYITHTHTQPFYCLSGICPGPSG